MWYIVCIIRVKNYRGYQSIRKRNLHQNGFSSTTFEITTAFFLWTLILGGVFCDSNNYWGLVLSWSCSLTRSCCWFLIYWCCFAAELFDRSSSSLQPVDFSFQPSSDVLSFEFPFVTSVTALGFQFNLYLSEYSRAKYLCCIRIISIKKKIFKQISTFPLLYLNFHCIS